MLTKGGEKIYKMKYAKTGKWEVDAFKVAEYVSNAETTDELKDKYSKIFYELIYNLVFLPGGRTLANSATGIKNLLNCFVLPIDDSRRSIYKTLQDSAEIFAHGGGIGFNFSKIREEGAEITTTGGEACLTGDTIVYRNNKKGVIKKSCITLARLYELRQRPNRLLENTFLRSVDEKTHVICKNKFIDIVNNGIQDIYEVKTGGGYSIKATLNHRFMDDSFEYKKLLEFTIGDGIAVNGIKFCSKCGKPITGKSLCISCHNKNQIKSNALLTTARQRKECRSASKNYCEMCKAENKRFEIHHIDENPYNNTKNNLLNLCPKCHQGLHASKRAFGDPYKQKYITLDRIVSIKYLGKDVVYDLQMESPNNNFIANGFVSHNSGPLSFLQLFDTTGEVISQASRRGAQLAALDVDHPDIERFIHYKSTPNHRNKRLLEEYKRNLRSNKLNDKGEKYFHVLEKTLQDDQLAHFNVSVLINDEFMVAVNEDKDWSLISRKTNQPVYTLKAKDLIRQIAEMAWESGDPGVLFYNRTNEDNMVKYLGDIKVTNPCVTGDTLILTVNNGIKPIKELADEKENLLVYTWNPETKLPEVSIMMNPRMTNESAELMEITFDSGLKLKCTPDHNLFTFRGEKIAVKDLKIGQAVRAYSVSLHSDGHLRAHGYADKKVQHKYTARMVWEYFHETPPEEFIIHHIDFNKLNNKIENLELLSNSEHNSVHYPYRVTSGFNHKVVEIKYLEEKEPVYNGTVDGTHTYIICDPTPIAGEYSGIVSANCSIYGTLVSTEKGLVPVEKISVGDSISTINGTGIVKSTEHHKSMPVYKVVLSDGAEIIVTKSHQFLASKDKRDFFFDFMSLDNLNVGNYIKISPLSLPNNELDLQGIDEKEFGFLVGCFIGDGCYTPGMVSKSSMAISVSQDTPEWNKMVLDSLEKFGFKSIKENRSKLEKSMAYFVRGDEVQKFLSLSKLIPSRSINKRIPMELLNSNENILKGLIDGLISTDGNINLSSKKPMIRLKTASKQLAKDLRTVLLMFGIHARIYSYFRKEHKIGDRVINNKNPYYEVLILSSEANKFKNTFDITHPNKKLKLNLLDTGGYDSWSAKIKSIEYYRESDVCDIFEPESDTWIVDGIVNRGCGEVPLLPYEACCLGSLNLTKFVEENENKELIINFPFMEYAVRNSIRFLDDVQEVTELPIEEVNYYSKGLRRVGLGVFGWADMLAMLEIPYNSKDAIELGNYIGWFISFFSWLESIELAEEKGAFKLYEKDKVDLSVVEKVLHSKYNQNKFNMEQIRNTGLRNVSVTSIAPTGSLALLAGCVVGDTLIHTIDGKKKIKDIVGTEQYVYSSGEKEPVVKRAYNIRKTREKAEVWKIKFDTNDELILTPDHKVMLGDGSWKEAKDLKFNDRVRIFSRALYNPTSTSYGAAPFALNMTNLPRKYEHVAIAECKYKRKIKLSEVVHHVDHNHFNNSIDNLIIMDKHEHNKLHGNGLINWSRGLIGRTYFEIHGEEKTKEIKRKQFLAKSGKRNPRYGHRLTDEEKRTISEKTKEAMQRPEVKERLLLGIHNYHKNKKELYEENHKVVSVEFYGYEDVYNMEVEDTENYVANDVVIHNCNSGIEPFFALFYKRNITEGIGNTAKDYMIEVNPILLQKLEKYKVPMEEINKLVGWLSEGNNFRDFISEKIPEKLKRVFIASHDITPFEHVDMQATWQQFITNSISKTINLSEDATVQDIEDVIIYAWNQDIKGITCYRDRSKTFQILNVGK
jgi:ribonucleotide reductase alpha subunit